MGLYIEEGRLRCTGCSLNAPVSHLPKRFDITKVKHSCNDGVNPNRYDRFARPSFVKKAVNFTKASAEHIKKGQIPTNEELHKIRLKICDGCDHGNNEECFICGCNLPVKIGWAEQKCPLGKWPNSEHMRDLILRDKQPANLRNAYQNAACFFIGSGPSLEKLNLDLLKERGILTFAVNNVAAYKNIKPNFWTSTDEPQSFHSCIWKDPTIIKFVRQENAIKLDPKLGKVVNLYTYNVNEDFNVKQFFDEPTINWGNQSSLVDAYRQKGGRSVLYAALRIMFYLGIRRVYLIGCDFKMIENRPYVFNQGKWSGGIKTNNNNYDIMNVRLKHLNEKALTLGYKIYNCTPDSHLTAFPNMLYEEAINKEKLETPTSLAKMYGGRDG